MATANEVLEEAKDFKRDIDEGLSIKAVAKKTGCHYQYVLMSLKLLDAPTEVHEAIPEIGKSKATRIAYHYYREPELQKLLAKLAIEGKKEERERDKHRPKRDLVKAALYENGKPAQKRARAILWGMLKGKTPEPVTAGYERKGNGRKTRLKPSSTIPKHGSSRGNSGREGEEHQRLKQYVKDNPSCLSTKIKRNGLKSEMERKLPSNDSMDVSFENKDCWIGVEVKSCISDESDIERGLYQCVKYRAVMEGCLAVQGLRKNVEVFLVLGCSLPESLLRAKEVLGVKVIPNTIPI